VRPFSSSQNPYLTLPFRIKLLKKWTMMLHRLGLMFLLPVVFGQVTTEPSENVTAAAVDLLDANHILHFLDVVDAFGHISFRNPDNESQFVMYVYRVFDSPTT